MTEGQLRFRTLMEDQRHNLAVETYERERAKAQTKSAEASMMGAQASMKSAEAAQLNAQASWKQANVARDRQSLNTAQFIVSMLWPDANTVFKSGAEVVSSLFG